MRRRSFLGLMAAAPFARAAVLNDYLVGGLYDLSAALRDGPVTLLAQEYDCLPVRFRTGDIIEGVRTRSILKFECEGAAFQPEDATTPTDNYTFRDFTLRCMAQSRSGPVPQHGLWLPSCRVGVLSGLRVEDFGGAGVVIYGQRQDGQPEPSDATLNMLENVLVRGCWIGFRLDGSVGSPRLQGGTANMNTLRRCLAFNCLGDGLQVMQGAANRIEQFISGQNGGNGITVGWYSNLFDQAVVERNGRYGVYKTGHAEQHDNWFPRIHNGGENALGLSNVPLD